MMNRNRVTEVLIAPLASAAISFNGLESRFSPVAAPICFFPTDPKGRTGAAFAFPSVFIIAGLRAKSSAAASVDHPLTTLEILSAVFTAEFRLLLAVNFLYPFSCHPSAIVRWGFSRFVHVFHGVFTLTYHGTKNALTWSFDLTLKPVKRPTAFFANKFYTLFFSRHNGILPQSAGSGTTAKMSKMLQRQFIGFDISQEYVDLAKRRIAAAPVPLPFVMDEPAVKVEQVKLFCD